MFLQTLQSQQGVVALQNFMNSAPVYPRQQADGTPIFQGNTYTPNQSIYGSSYLLNSLPYADGTVLPKGTHKYENFIRPSELYGWAEDAGLNCEKMTGMHYNPLTDVYSLGPGVDVNYIMSTTRPEN